jgi:hypothetical protein
MASDEFYEALDDMFKVYDINAWWPDYLREYEMLGFTDPISDDERIAEFNYILQEYRKYIFSHEALITEYAYNLPRMLVVVEDLIAKAPEFSNERKKIVYNRKRDNWLLNLKQLIVEELGDTDGEEVSYE